MRKIFDWFKRIDARHKAWYKGNGYKFSKPLMLVFFVLALSGLGVVALVDGFSDKVYVSCPEFGTPCENPLVSLGCDHYCCSIDFLAPGMVCGEPVSWFGRNYSWLVFVLFVVVIFVNHFVFNRGYDFDRYWGDWK